MDTVNKEWNIKVGFITFYKFSVTENVMSLYSPGRPKEYYPFKKTFQPPVPHSKGEYRIINNSRKVVYVGYSNDLNRRMNEHIRTGKINSVNCIFAYQVADSEASRDSLASHEKKKIEKHKPWLNKRAGGAGRPFGRKKKSEDDG